MIDLSIIIVNWNTRDLLCNCLESVFYHTKDISFEVLVVDNASADESTAVVNTRFPQVKLIANNKNVGFTRANNQALPQCQGRYILLLNPDTVVLNGALHKLLLFMDSHPEVGVCGPHIIQPDGTARTESCGFQPTLRTMFAHYLFLSRLFANTRFFRGVHLISKNRTTEPLEVEWVSGACMMVRRSALSKVGFLDESLFFGDDFEWCARFQAQNWQIYYVPQASIIHYTGSAVKLVDGPVSTSWVHGLHRYFARNHSWFSVFCFDLILFVGLFLRALLHWGEYILTQDRRWQAKAKESYCYSMAAMRLLLIGTKDV